MNFNFKAVVGLLLLLAVVGLGRSLTGGPIDSMLMAKSESVANKQVIGPIVSVNEEETELKFLARVDTGAATCSLHAAEKHVVDGKDFMEDNLGKTVRFRVENRHGESEWIERKIVEVRKIRTSEGEETRYLVPMRLTCSDVEREVLVSLNDRSRMSYTMLLGRNYLEGQFLVDVTGR